MIKVRYSDMFPKYQVAPSQLRQQHSLKRGENPKGPVEIPPQISRPGSTVHSRARSSLNASVVKNATNMDGGHILPLAEQKPVTRRSYFSPEQWMQIMSQHKKLYPPNAFKVPYLSRSDEALQEEDISPIHIAAGTKNIALLNACFPVFDVDCPDKEGRTPLIYAVIAEDLKTIELLNKHGADLDKTDNDGRSAIHWASFYGKHEILKYLIKLGANWRIRDNEGRTSLHWSTGCTESKCLQLLLDKATAFEINEPDNEQMSAIHWSVYHCHPKHTELLLKHNAKILLTDVEGKTSLHWSASHKDISCAKMLIDYDIRVVNVADLDGRTALHLACAENNLALVSLLSSFADCNIDARDLTQRSALHWAAVSGHHYLVSLLLEKGASDSLKDGIGATPLHYACSKNHAQCIAALMSRKSAAYLPDNEGRYALTWAVTKGHVQSVRILLEKKVDTKLEDKQGSTALHAAAHAGQTHCVALLLENGAEVDALDKQGHTPLFRAVEKGFAETANILIQAHADVNKKDGEKRSPLHWAALFGHLPVLSLLLANGAVIDDIDETGKTPLHCGAFGGFNEVVKYLLECGAAINKKDSEQFTPLHWACLMGHHHTAELLLIAGAAPNPTDTRYTLFTPMDYAVRENHAECIRVLQSYKGKTLAGLKVYSAVLIQSTWRGYKTRKFMLTQRSQLIQYRKRREDAAIVIQRFIRMILACKPRPPPVSVPFAGKYVVMEPIGNNIPELKSKPSYMDLLNSSMDSWELEYFRMESEKRREEGIERHRPPNEKSPSLNLRSIDYNESGVYRSSTSVVSSALGSSRSTHLIHSDKYKEDYASVQSYQHQLELIERQMAELERLKRLTIAKIKSVSKERQ